jgi:hypothetical protein
MRGGLIMNFLSVLLSCFGVLVLAGVYEALQAKWELYRKQALMRQSHGIELPLNEPQHQGL